MNVKSGIRYTGTDKNNLFMRLSIVLSCLFVIMVGFGVLMPVLPFYTERMVNAEGISPDKIAIHVGLLTSAYPMSQLIPVIFLGKLSDRIGRKPLLVLGLTGFVLMQFFTAMAATLWGLYAARIVGGILTSPVIPVGNAYISDLTGKENRKKALAWSGAALGSGAVIGPAIGGMLAENDLHFFFEARHIRIDQFSVPFLFAGMVGIVVLLLLVWKLKEPAVKKENLYAEQKTGLAQTLKALWMLFFISFILQLGLTTFEGSYSIYAKEKLMLKPVFIGIGFLICGLVMAIFQPVIANRTKPGFIKQHLFAGMLISGLGIFLLAFTDQFLFVNILIALMAFGMAVVTPNLLTAITTYNQRNSGQNLAVLSSFNGLGQIAGPVFGTWIFTRGEQLPFMTTGGMLIAVSGILFLAHKKSSLKT